MTAFRFEVNWDDPSRPPLPSGLTEIPTPGDAPSLWWSQQSGILDTDDDGIRIWHWCTQSVYLAAGANPAHVRPHWVMASGDGHDLISLDPLHLEPSVYWPDCCGLHGWIRDGRWTSA